MALFSDNPFVGMIRAQKRRESEAAMAAQQAIEQQKQQRQKAGMERLKAEEEFRAENPGSRELQAMSKAKSFYSYGLGRSSPWTTKSVTDPQTGAIKKAPVLKRGYVSGNTSPEGRYLFAASNMGNPFPQKQVTVLPPAVFGKQEYRSLWEGKGGLGSDVISAPEKFVRGKGTSSKDLSSTFYSTVTGQPMGTMMGRGAYSGFGKKAAPPPPQRPTLAGGFGVTQDPALTQATQLSKGGVVAGGQPLAHTGFGQMARDQMAEQYQTPISRAISSSPSTSPMLASSGVPRFPFAGAESSFERSARTATTFGGMQMFPYAGY